MCTCTVHSGVKKTLDWTVDQIADVFHTTHTVQTRHVIKRKGQYCGDIDLVTYLTIDPVHLVLDLLIDYDRFGCNCDPSLNGHLHYPNDTFDTKTDLLTGLIAGKQGWKCPVALLATCCGSKSLKIILIDSDFRADQALRRAKQGTKGGGWRSVPHTLCRLFQTCRTIGVYLSSEENLHRSLTRQGIGYG